MEGERKHFSANMKMAHIVSYHLIIASTKTLGLCS